jgi:hypothetical protein
LVIKTSSIGFFEVEGKEVTLLSVLAHLRCVLEMTIPCPIIEPSKGSMDAEVPETWNVAPITFFAITIIASSRSSAGIEGHSDTSAA